MNNGRDKQQLSTAEQIIRRLFDGPVPEGLKELVQGWLAIGNSEEEVEAALGEIFEDRVLYEKKPRRELIAALPALRIKAGYAVRAKSTSLRRRILSRAAAVLIPLLIAGIAGLWLHRAGDSVGTTATWQTVSVAADGRTQNVALPDGSTVRLSAGGTMNYARNFGEDRTVELNGEGYFRVMKAAGSPFTVKSEAMTVTVRGTEFLMRAVDTESMARITLTTGEVEVTAGEHMQTLTPGQILTYHKLDKTIELAEAGRGEVLRLRGVSMRFDGEPLDEILQTVAGYYGADIQINPDVNTRREVIVGFDGTETLDDVLSVLRSITSGGFNYAIEGDTVTITR